MVETIVRTAGADATNRGQRELGSTEAIFWLSGQACSYNVVCFAQIEGSVEPPALRAALRAVQCRHPLLRAGVAHEARSAPRFVQTEGDIPVRTAKGTTLEAEVEAELAAP